MGLFPRFSALCPACGRVELFSLFVRALAHEAPPPVGVPEFEFRWRCPKCGLIQLGAVCEEMAHNLVNAGAVVEAWELPVIERPIMSPLTEADIRQPLDDELARLLG